MKKYNIIIPDNKEKNWDYLIKNKKENNITETILRLLDEEVEKIKGEKVADERSRDSSSHSNKRRKRN